MLAEAKYVGAVRTSAASHDDIMRTLSYRAFSPSSPTVLDTSSRASPRRSSAFAPGSPTGDSSGTGPSRRGSVTSVSSLGSFRPLRRSSITSLLPSLTGRRSSLPSLSKPHLKRLSANEKETVVSLLMGLETKHRALLEEVAQSCEKQFGLLRRRIEGMDDDIKCVLTRGARHCTHRECVQKQLNMGWKKYERACIVTDKFGDEIFKYIRRKYTRAWQEGQADIEFTPGDAAWWPAREQLSNMVQYASEKTVNEANNELKSAYKTIKALGRALAKAQKENDARPVDTKPCGSTVASPAQLEKKDSAGSSSGSDDRLTSMAPATYVVKYVLREPVGYADVIFHDIVMAQESVLTNTESVPTMTVTSPPLLELDV
eukprot:comp22877_c0_seq1/m.36142 comp22877_c0_seq1/g.36142  ORF comp22877_c0_seq1/g.36142 comp22877_c0_seq1/m.36142 type:complete len:373 (-) comp22877_c0_seq1:560-1678(-)